MTKFMKLIFLPLLLLLSIGLTAQFATQAQQRPVMYVVMFRADWCGPCKIVEPNLDRALRSLNDPSLEVVVIDVTDGPRIERSAHIAFDHQIAAQYNMWYGVTGFAAMIDADTKNTLGCVNMMYDAATMANHIKNLKTYAIANQQSYDITCPAPNAPR